MSLPNKSIHPETSKIMNFVVSIIILCKDNLNYTRRCIESILQNTSQAKSQFEIICVDNGSQDGSVQYLKGLEDAGQIKAIYNKENAGFPKGNNQAAAIAKGEYLLLLNNDTVVCEHWLENMLRCIKSDNKLAAVGSFSNMGSGNHQSPIPCPYKNAEELQKFGAHYGQADKEVDFLVFFCTLIRRDVWDEIGGLDEDMTPGNFEDNEFCWFAIQKGYKMKIAGNAFVHHYISKTWQKDDPKKLAEYARIMARNQKIFLKKIGQYKIISLCMIVSDREKPETLKRCVDSIAQWIDNIYVVFNYKHFKNNRRILNLMKAFKNSASGLFNFEYVKFTDFSDMRNKSLDMATGDYIIWCDADDVWPNPAGIRDIILHYPDIDVFQTKLESRTEIGTQECIIKNSIFKNHRTPEGKCLYYFTNRVHEDLSFSTIEKGAKKVLTDIVIKHLGYTSKKVWKAKNRRNYKLALLDMKDNPHSLVYWGIVNNLVIAGGKKNLEQAIKYIDECFKKCGLKPEDPLTPKMWVMRGIACQDAGQHLAAKQSYHKAFDEWQHPEAAINLAELYMREKNYDKVIEILSPLYKSGQIPMSNISCDPIQIELLMLRKLGDCYWFKAAAEKDDAAQTKLLLQAEVHYRENLSLRKYDLETADRLCDILRRTGRIGEANIITVVMVNKYQNYSAGWYNLAMTELMNKRYITAELFLREAVRWKPDYQEAKHNLQEVRKVLYGKKRR